MLKDEHGGKNQQGGGKKNCLPRLSLRCPPVGCSFFHRNSAAAEDGAHFLYDSAACFVEFLDESVEKMHGKREK